MTYDSVLNEAKGKIDLPSTRIESVRQSVSHWRGEVQVPQERVWTADNRCVAVRNNEPVTLQRSGVEHTVRICGSKPPLKGRLPFPF